MAAMSNLKMLPIAEDVALELLSGSGSWRQYPAYAAEAAKRVSSSSLFFVISHNDQTIALANLRERRLPIGLGSIGLVSHGPVLLRPPELWQGDLDLAFEALADLANKTGQEIRIDPDPVWQLSGVTARLPAGAYEDPHSSPYRTIVLPIGDGQDAVRKRLHGKWRNILKQAEKAGLRTVVSSDPADFARMDPLLEELISRKGFSINQDPAFFARAVAMARGDERLLVTLVLADDEVVSAHIGAYSGQMACYLLGATNARGRQLRAAYAAQWAAIGNAIELGQQWYDLGGIDPVENPDVYHFKKRMGGHEIETGRTIILPAGGWRAYSTSAARLAWRLLSR
ncbi:MAG: GNAT family N-acetyltransferase [Porphyrobacter sp.]|nr:GNAT family N-acetyltransferase [Porphyrobacter sp.]